MKSTLKNLLESCEWVNFVEIAWRRNETKNKILEKARNLLALGIDCLVFSDQAGGSGDFFSMEEILASGVFSDLPREIILPVVVTKRRNKRELEQLIGVVRKTGVPNLFPVTGDPAAKDISGITSLDFLPQVAGDFFCGGVANPVVDDIPRILKKIEAGTKFLITQASYDQESWDKWVEELRKREIYKLVPIIPLVIPIASSRTLAILNNLGGVQVAKSLLDKFGKLEEDTVIKIQGLEMAKEMIKSYKEAGIFGGVYVFSRSVEVVENTLF